ncbi:hypothetical protein IAU60_000395 [Kwoniella sp. DSM 27419]
MAENNTEPQVVVAEMTTPSGIETPSPSAQPPSPAETIRAENAAGSSSDPSTQVSAGAGEASNPVQRAFTQSLNRNNFEEEVGQVMGTLSGWWGGVKKQSASALTSLKTDLDKGLAQAQADLEYLRTAKVEVVRKDPAEYAAEQEAEKAKKAAAKAAAEEQARSKEKGKGKETEGAEPSTAATAAAEAGSSATAFLNRLTSSTTQLQHSLQTTLQSTLAAAANNPTLNNPAALRQQLAENLHLSSARDNLQISMKQAEKLAEEYLKKSEGLLKDAEKWVEDAVKVVPPDEDQRMVSMGWEGGDMYSFSTSSTKTNAGDVLFDSGAGKSRSASSPMPSLAMASSRKDALLRRLREDKEALLVDPEGEGETDERKAEFRSWVGEHWDKEKVAGREQEEGHVGAVRMNLVPEHLTDEQFWQRYLFHKHMIEAEEQKRKALLQSTAHEDTEDFNWDDDPEDSTSPTITASATPAIKPDTTESTPKIDNDGKMPSAVPKAIALTSASTSPRDSEESYDLVSDQGAGSRLATPAKVAPSSTEDDDDSDWE